MGVVEKLLTISKSPSPHCESVSDIDNNTKYSKMAYECTLNVMLHFILQQMQYFRAQSKIYSWSILVDFPTFAFQCKMAEQWAL